MYSLFTFPPFESESLAVQVKRRYILFLYPLVLVSALYFLYVFNIEYKTYMVNKYIVPPFLLVVISPLFYSFTKNFKYFAYIFFLSSVTYVYILIYMVGGIKAPGLFWIVATPVFAAVILDRIEAMFSTILVFGTLILFYYLDHQGITFPFPVKLDMEVERLRNVVTFSLFFVGLFIFYLKNEERNRKTQEQQRNKIDNLLRIIIHDFATPLMIIANNAKKLQSSILDQHNLEEYKNKNLELAIAIEKHSGNLKDMINQVRSLKAIKDGKYRVENEIVSLNKAILNAVDNCSFLLEKKDVSIDVESDGEFFIKANALILEKQIFQNLLTNAIKFSPVTGKIAIKIEGSRAGTTVKITDHGIGMPVEIREQLFNIYAKTSRRGTNGEVGTGYGMPIVYEFVTLFAGTIEVHSVEEQEDPLNHGTTVIVTFPVIKN